MEAAGSKAAFDPAAHRRKKTELQRVIHLQRQLIEDHTEEDGTEDSTDHDLDWYTVQNSRLDKFKNALQTLRLDPDEFQVRVSSSKAKAGGRTTDTDSGASGSTWQTTNPGKLACVDHRLRISAHSQLTFIPEPNAATPGQLSSVGVEGALVFHIDQLKNVQAPQEEPDSSKAGSREGKVGMEWKCGTHTSLVSCEPLEMAEVLGAHLKRYNQSRLTQVARLKEAYRCKCTPYERDTRSHNDLLRRLWKCAFPSKPWSQERQVCKDWVKVGFQGSDPATDFRGMGILGLENLVYFGETYPAVFHQLVTAQGHRDYPLACAGINLTAMLLDMLQMNNSSADRPPFSPEWDTPMFHFFCHIYYRDKPFEDMYCYALRMLDQLYVEMDAEYMDFTTVLTTLQARLQEVLDGRPMTFQELKQMALVAGQRRSAAAPGGDEGTAGERTPDATNHEEVRNILDSAMATLNPLTLQESLGLNKAGKNIGAMWTQSTGVIDEKLGWLTPGGK